MFRSASLKVKDLNGPGLEGSSQPGNLLSTSLPENAWVNVGKTIFNRPRYEPGEVILKYDDQSPSMAENIEDKFGVSIVERFDLDPDLMGPQGGLVRAKLPHGMNVEQAVKLLQADESVEFAEPNFRIYLEEPTPAADSSMASEQPEKTQPNDLHYKLWGLHNTGQTRGKRGADIEAKKAWEITVGDRDNGPIIAVIDSGVDVAHPDLIQNLWTNPGEIPGDGIDNDNNGVVDDVHGYNAFHHNNDLFDGKVHGTHVAGTIGATGNNGIGITGVAQEARLMPIRIFANTGHTNQATVLRALNYADQMGARVTANSWGGIESKAMREAYEKSPALHIASAGNSGRDNDLKPHFPGSYPIDNMVAVAATDHKDQLGSFSNYGAKSVHLGAPGQDIYSTMPRNRYKSFSGTSMACPHVAGVAGLILTEYPEATNEQVKARLLHGTEPLDTLQDVTVSGGRLNAALALEHDQTSPGLPKRFEAKATAGRITVEWNETGDDGDQGTARHVELRVSGQAINQTNFSDTELVSNYVPDQAGTEKSIQRDLSLSRLPRTYHFGLKAFDNVGLSSPLQTAKVTVPAAKVAFEDGPDTPWQTEEWGRIELPNGKQAWSDSPHGDYGYNDKRALTSPVISLQNHSNSTLKFQSRLALGRGDYLRVQVKQGDRGWRNIGLYQGQEDWSEKSLSLARYDGQDIQLRFLMMSDGATNSDGVSLSDIEILAEDNQTNH